jgi:hypothetical protein
MTTLKYKQEVVQEALKDAPEFFRVRDIAPMTEGLFYWEVGMALRSLNGSVIQSYSGCAKGKIYRKIPAAA